MARARNIKPAFFKNEILAELDPLDRLAFAGLWTLADFKGCLEYRPKRIKAEILPYDDCDIVQILSNLDQSGFIRIYSVQGREYIKVLGFTDHQHPHKNEIANGSNIPDYNQQAIEIKEEIKKPEKIGTSLELNGTNPPDSLNPITDSLNPITDSRKPDKVGIRSRFKKPTQLEIKNYMMESGLPESQAVSESIKFFSYYDSKGWVVGKTKMKKWKSSVVGWIVRNKEFNKKPESFETLDYGKMEGSV